VDLITTLLSKGSRVDETMDDYGCQHRTALLLALEGGHAAAAEALCDAGASVSANAHRDGTTALMVAARRGCVRSMSALLEHGASVATATGPYLGDAGRTALHEAACGGHASAATLLILHGADVAARRSSNSHTPLMDAAACGFADALDALVAGGSDVNALTRDGASVLALATTSTMAHPRARERILATLRERGAVLVRGISTLEAAASGRRAVFRVERGGAPVARASARQSLARRYLGCLFPGRGVRASDSQSLLSEGV